jgi:pimeloyl-ACP methyl ester carboxylesterase
MSTDSDWIADYFSARWADRSGTHRFTGTTSEQLRIWQQNGRQRLSCLLKMEKFSRAGTEHRFVSSRTEDGYVREEILVRTEADYWSPVTVLRPSGDTPDSGVPVIALHGHLGGGRAAVAGDRTNPAVGEAIDRFNYDYGRQLALLGFTVYCPDARGFGDRRSGRYESDAMGCYCREIGNLAESLGMTLTGMLTWDLCRLVDFIQSVHLSGDGLIGCVGFSGGGLQALYGAALDERIGFTIISGYFYGFKESHLELYGNCSCNYVPGLWEHFDMGDIASLIAPRHLFLETGAADDLNGASGTENVSRQVTPVRRAYGLLGATDHLRHQIYEGPHQFYGTDSLEWAVSLVR